LVAIGWKNAMAYLLEYKSLGLHFDIVLGQFVDLETQVLAKKFFSNFSHNFISIGYQHSSVLSDFRSFQTLNCSSKDLEDADVIVFCGSNLLREYPLLYLKAARYYNTKGKIILSFGLHVKLGYYLGNRTKNFVDFLAGKSEYSWILAKARQPIFIIGTSFLEFFPNIFNYIFNFNNLLLRINSKLKMNFLMSSISDLGGFEVGLYAKNKVQLDLLRFNMLYLIGADYDVKLDGFYPLYDYDMVVYQGHHGDKLAERADVILPSVIPFEKTVSFINILGKFITNKFVVTPVGDVRTDWKILNSLLASDGIFCYEDYDNLWAEINLQYIFPLLENDLNELKDVFAYDQYYFKNIFARKLEIKWPGVFNFGKKESYYKSDAVVRSSYLLMLMSKKTKSVKKLWR